MIFTRYGGLVTVIADCGLHCPQGSKYEARLLKVNIAFDHGAAKLGVYRFADFLKADNGYNEIIQVMQTVPSITLTGVELVEAIEQAS